LLKAVTDWVAPLPRNANHKQIVVKSANYFAIGSNRFTDTALYMRLSRDDETFGDSVSIETQRSILHTFAKENGLHVYDEYVDDGWSGTNFERPAFRRMMEDVEAGNVNCIITKDLSRFGREHVMMDYYLEYVFPEKRIRYIAVAENEDTEKGLSDFVPFKNLFNEWFAKDTSRKVKAAMQAKFANGERVFPCPPLGYKRHPEQKNALVIDEETKWIIEKIFDLAAHGAGSSRIAKRLMAEKIPAPGWLHYKRYGLFSNIYADAPEEKKYLWTISQVHSILKDETYIGNSIHNRQGNVSYKNKKRIKRKKDEWYRVENTHEPLIAKDVFDQVQEQITSRHRPQKTGETQLFAGLLKCADCGRSVTYCKKQTKTKRHQFFVCSTYRKYGRMDLSCTSHHIRYEVLYTYVLARIRHWSMQAQLDERKLLDHLLQTGDKERAAKEKKLAAEFSKAEKRKTEVDKLFARLYEDWAMGRITEYNFKMLSEKYQTEQLELDAKIQSIGSDLQAKRQTTSDAEKWIALIQKYADPDELTSELLNSLIEKIVIHEAFKTDSGTREQKIEIYYRFVGKLDE